MESSVEYSGNDRIIAGVSVSEERLYMQGTQTARIPDEREQLASRHEQVAAIAYRLWEERGYPIGSPETDWYAAEQQLNRDEDELQTS